MKKVFFISILLVSGLLTADDFSYRGIFLGMSKTDLLKEVNGLPFIETSDKIVIGNYHDSSVLVSIDGSKVSDFTIKTDSIDDKNEFIRLIAELSAKFGKPAYLDSKKYKALFVKDGKFISLRINKKSSGFTKFMGFGYSKECYSIKNVLED